MSLLPGGHAGVDELSLILGWTRLGVEVQISSGRYVTTIVSASRKL